MSKNHYSASFTAGALLHQEFTAVLGLLKQENYLALLDKERNENRYLKIKTENARIRVTTEIKKRARVVSREAWEFFETANHSEQKLILFYAVLKSSPLAKDYHFEVVLKKWKKMDLQLSRYDLQMRLDELSSFDEEVELWSETTKVKTLTQYIRILREAGLMRDNELIRPPVSGSEFWEHFVRWGDPWFLEACFFTKNEIEAYI